LITNHTDLGNGVEPVVFFGDEDEAVFPYKVFVGEVGWGILAEDISDPSVKFYNSDISRKCSGRKKRAKGELITNKIKYIDK